MRILSILFLIFFLSCERNAITGRRQLNLFPEADLQKQALTEYRNFLSKNKVVPIGNNKQAEMVKRVGLRISEAITNTKKKQCTYLNNGIRKYGKENFSCKLIKECV